MPSRVAIAARCVLTGACIAAAVPPWGWWPLAIVGFALFDRLLAETTARQRFVRGWLATAAWLYPAMLWMFDLTPPGYVAAGGLYAAYFGAAAAVTPPDRPWRAIVFPGAFALAELARWSWPFGGVPLANVALGQVASPLGQTARVAGALLVVVVVVVVGQALSAVIDRHWRQALVGAGAVVVALAVAAVHPRADVVRQVDVAVVQGGGPTQTRASSDQQPVVLARHIEASGAIDQPVDLILWPENVVNPGRYLDFGVADQRVAAVAIEHRATLLPGWFYVLPDGANTVNYQSAVSPEGVEIDRYDKVRIVPFGEFVPLRSLIEVFNDEIPQRDVLPGTSPPVLDTDVGPVGVAISWEAFFDHRSRHAVREGAQLLTNPTNGSSYWLTQVHTQQVAANQLRAIETDRWLLMAGPTGLSGVVDPEGNVLHRTGIGERAVVIDTVEMRTGRTLASIVGAWPALLYGLAAAAVGLWRIRR